MLLMVMPAMFSNRSLVRTNSNGWGWGWGGGGDSAYHDFNAYYGTWHLSGLEKRILCLDICGSSLIILL